MTLRAWLQRAPVLGYFALTFAWSWVCWALSPAIRPQLPWLAKLLMFAGSFGSSLAAIVVVASTRKIEGLRAWSSRCLQWRIGWSWWAFALLLPLAVMSLAAGLHIALGGMIGPAPASVHLLMTVVNLPLFFIDGTAQAHIPPELFLLSVMTMSVVFACLWAAALLGIWLMPPWWAPWGFGAGLLVALRGWGCVSASRLRPHCLEPRVRGSLQPCSQRWVWHRPTVSSSLCAAGPCRRCQW